MYGPDWMRNCLWPCADGQSSQRLTCPPFPLTTSNHHTFAGRSTQSLYPWFIPWKNTEDRDRASGICTHWSVHMSLQTYPHIRARPRREPQTSHHIQDNWTSCFSPNTLPENFPFWERVWRQRFWGKMLSPGTLSNINNEMWATLTDI